MRLLGLVVLIILVASGLAARVPREDNGHSKYPSPKLWWARRILNDDFYTAGRLTARQTKYAVDHGFKSIISMFNFTDQVGNDPHGVGDYYVTSNEEQEIAEENGLYFGVVLAPDGDWQSYEMIRTAVEMLTNAPKPVLFHCMVGFSATLGVLGSMATGTLGSKYIDKPLRAEEVFEVAAGYGYDFSTGAMGEIIFNITRQNVLDITIPLPVEVSIPDWSWKIGPTRPVGKNLYVAGQIHESYLSVLNGTIGVIVNLRDHKGSEIYPTQGEVTLLNVKDGTGTYTGEGRQSDAELMKNRIDPNRPNSFISEFSTVNYERINPIEFGDDIGYNEMIEMMAIDKYPLLHYRSMPIGDGLSKEWWDMYGEELVRHVGMEPSILVHDDTGFMSAIVSTLAIAKSERKSEIWAHEHLKQMGYPDIDENTQYVMMQIIYSDDVSIAAAVACIQQCVLLAVSLIVLCLIKF